MTASEDYFQRLVDLDSLRNYLNDQFGSVDRYDVQHLQAGHSNETLLVKWGQRDLIIRRPPPGEKAEKAHDVLREYRVLDALQETDVPVPPTLTACDDHEVIGSDFYVMEKVEGDVIRQEVPERFRNSNSRRTLGEELVDRLAQIHRVDYEAAGLGDFGHPEGFTERQVDTWSKQLIWAISYTEDEREVPELYEIGEWLKDNTPSEYPHTLVHGDYKMDNVMFAPGVPPEIAAIFDWELSALGDPLTDVGWMLSFWRNPGDPEPASEELAYTYMENEEYASRAELVERYEQQSGIEYTNDTFYRTLAVYKLCGLGEMFFARHLTGDSDDPLYPKMEDGVPRLAQRALNIINGSEPL
ncbi:MAG: phosphotransferase family protein [bacterium]